MFMESLDLFAVKPADIYTFKKSFFYSTIYTKILTIIVAMSTIGYFSFRINGIIYHENPNLSFYETYSKDPSLINFGEENFFLAFGLENQNNSLVYADPSIFQMKMNINNKTKEFDQIEFENCDSLYKTGNVSTKFNKFLQELKTPESFYCLKDYSKFKLKGTYDSRDFFNIDLTIQPCNKTDATIICKSDDDLNNFYTNSMFVMKYSTTSLEPFDYDNPLKEQVADYFQPLIPTKLTEIYLNFAPLLLSNKFTSILFAEESKPQNGILLISEKYSSKKLLTDIFFRINFRLDKLQKNISRLYLSWIEIICSVGGFLAFLKALINLLLLGYVRSALIQRISNEIFDYQKILAEMPEEKNVKNQLREQKTQHIFKIKMSLWYYLKSFCTCLKQSNETIIIKQALKQMKQNYDIGGLLNRIIENEKIQFVLPETQYKMLKSMSKPKLNLIPRNSVMEGHHRSVLKPPFFENSIKSEEKSKGGSIEICKNNDFGTSNSNKKEIIINKEQNIEEIEIFQKKSVEDGGKIEKNSIKSNSNFSQFQKTSIIEKDQKNLEKNFFEESAENIEKNENSSQKSQRSCLKMEDLQVANENQEESSHNLAEQQINNKNINELKADLSYFYYFDKTYQ